MALRVPNVLLGPISLGSFYFLGVALVLAETPFAKTPFSWFLKDCPHAVRVIARKNCLAAIFASRIYQQNGPAEVQCEFFSPNSGVNFLM